MISDPPIFRPSLAAHRLWLTLLLLLLLLLLQVSPIQQAAERYLQSALIEAGVIFGMSRLSNAVISVLQSAEFSAIVVGFNVGEVLDPINDTIERFSTGMFLASLSLLAQRLLLDLFGSEWVRWLLSALTALAALALWLVPPRAAMLLLRTLLLLIALRFLLVAVALGSQLFAQAALQTTIASSQSAMQGFERMLSDIAGGSVIGDQDLPSATAASRQRQQELQDAAQALTTQLAAFDAAEAANPSPGLLARGQQLFDRNASRQRAATAAERHGLEQQLKLNQEQQAAVAAELRCLDQAAQGEDCRSLLQRLRAIDIGAIGQITSVAGEMTSALLTLLTAILLKTMVFPLLAGWAALRLLRRLINLLASAPLRPVGPAVVSAATPTAVPAVAPAVDSTALPPPV